MYQMLLVSPDGRLYTELMLTCASRYLCPGSILPNEIPQSLSRYNPDVFLLSGDYDHEALIQILLENQDAFSRIPVILLFRPPAPNFIAIHELIQAGASHMLMLPFRLSALQKTLSQAALIHPRISCENQDSGFVGRSLASRNIRTLINRYAGAKYPVLITGESGTGKEVIAKALYENGQHSQEVFCRKNCAAIPETLFESELFGSVPGAFTNATDRQGLFEFASQGCVFLDEIGTLALTSQGKLLRVLENGEFNRLGEQKTRKTQTRMIFASNENLEEKIEKKEFRLDLFYRISVLKIRIPPLRERKTDIIPLAGHILAHEDSGKLLSRQAADKLEAYSWPGNVRELKNVLLRGSILSKNKSIGPRDIVF